MPGGTVVNVVSFLAGTTITGVATAWKVAPILRRLSHLVDDLMGEPARPGVAARPGVVERLSTLEDDVADIKTVKESNASALLSLAATVDQIRAWMESQGKPPSPPQQRTA